jgi:hypothetical protein
MESMVSKVAHQAIKQLLLIRLGTDREHKHFLCRPQQRQAIVSGPRGLAAAVPGDDRVLADVVEPSAYGTISTGRPKASTTSPVW